MGYAGGRPSAKAGLPSRLAQKSPLFPVTMHKTMKSIIGALGALVAAWLAGLAAAGAQTTFAFHFNNTNGSDNHSALQNWATAVGAAGTVVNTVANGSGVSGGSGLPGVAGESSGTGFAYYVPATGVAPGACLLHATTANATNAYQNVQNAWFRTGTGSLSGVTVGDITWLSVSTRAQDGAAEMRFAIKVDGQWFASDTSFNQTSNMAWEYQYLDPKAVDWISGIGAPGSGLDLDLSDNPRVGLDPAGVVSAYGLCADTGDLAGAEARVRIDSYRVVTTVSGDPPAPTTIAVTPASVTLSPLGAQPFSAVLKDQYGFLIDPQPSFAWGVSGGGAIDANGLLAVGTETGTFTVSASAEGVTGHASFTVAPVTGFTVFSAFFNNGTGQAGDKAAAAYNWAAAVGASGTIVNSPSSVAGVSQGNTTPAVPVIAGASTSGGFLFHVPASGVAPEALMLYRDTLGTLDAFQDQPQGSWHPAGNASLTGLTLAATERLSVFASCPSTTAELRFAIKVGGQWFASDTSMAPATANAWTPFSINPATENWIPGLGTPGSVLDTDLSDNGVAAPLPGTSVISGYGVYAFTGEAAGNDARVRIDSYQITTIDFGGSSRYDTWAAGPFAKPFTNSDPAVDFDNDGLANLLEFVLGGDPTISQPGVAPAAATTGGNLVLTFKRSEDALFGGVEVRVRTSIDLLAWNPADDIVIGADDGTGPNGASYTVTADPVTRHDAVVVTIPVGAAGHKFARVVAIEE